MRAAIFPYNMGNLLTQIAYPDLSTVSSYWVVGRCCHEIGEMMCSDRQCTSSLVWLAFVLCLSGCSSKGVTALADGFQSYESPRAARKRLRDSGHFKGWKEKKEGTSPSDPRPPYQFLTMTGPFRMLGVDGDLKLVFYNDRLVETKFLTSHGTELSSALHQQGVRVPDKPGVEVTLDRRTTFRYDVDSKGVFNFSWRDEKLEDEWFDWVDTYS